MRAIHRSYGCRGRLKKPLAASLITCIVLFELAIGRAEVLTLDRALDIAMEQSPSIRQAKNSLESAEQNLKAENASLKSQFNLDLTPIRISRGRSFDDFYQVWYTSETRNSAASLSIDQRIKWTDAHLSLFNDFDWQESSSETESAGKRKTTTYRNVLYLTLNQPLFTYNRTKQTLAILRLEYEDARLRYEIQKLQIERTVTAQFYAAYRSRMSLEIAREDYKSKEESYAIIKNRVEAGISAREELFQAEVDFATSKAALENGEVEYENAVDEFKTVLGLPLEHELEVIADVQKIVVDVDLDKAVSYGLECRMELRRMDIALEEARYDMIRIGSEDEFRASVDLSYGLTGTDSDFRDIYRSPVKSQSISVQLNVPLWDWGKRKSNLKARELELDNQTISKEDEKSQIVVQIRQAYRSLQNQITQIEIAEKGLENAQLTYEINLERYRSGDISSKDIGEYQNQLSREKLRRVGALIDYRLYLLDMKIASLWDFENDKPVLEID